MFHRMTTNWVLTVCKRYTTVLLYALLASVCISLYFALFNSPPDYQQGEAVRLMYIHVPAAWMALGVYTAMALSSLAFLIWKSPVSDIIARRSAPVGTVFCGLCLITGSIWGKPIWGTWWVWDARLTSMLVLFFFYVGYILLANGTRHSERRAHACAYLALIGFINVPIVKFSVDWWNTLHQPASVVKMDGPTIESSILTPLLLMFVTYLLYYLWALFSSAQYEILQRKIKRNRLKQLG